MSRLPSLFTDLDASLEHQAGHILVAGNSGTGKTGCLSLIARAKISNPLTGLHLIDPDGELSPACHEYIGNPQHNLGWRRVHYLRPASTTEAFALPMLHVPDRAPLECHNKAQRALTVCGQAINFGAGDYGPRLSKFFYLGCLGLALTGRPLVDLPDLFTLSAKHLREIIGGAYPYPFMSDEWQSIDLLSDKNLLEYRDPLMSRLLPIFGNATLRRVFGPQRPLDIAQILRARECVLLDLSGLEHKDAVLIGKAYLSLIYHEALQREPNREPHACLMLDEAFDYMSADLARGFDRLRKRNIQLCIAIQRFSQLTKAADDDAVAILSAAVTNTRTKIVFGGLEPDDSDFMTRVLFTGFVDLEEWKDGSARPTAVGNKKEVVRNSSRAEHDAVHETYAHTTSHSHGEAIGTMSSTSTAVGEFTGSGDSAGMVMAPPVQLLGPSAPNASVIQYPLSESVGESNSRGTSEQSATASGSSHVSVDMHGEAVTRGRGISHGTSISEGQSETYVTDYQLLPTQLYSLPEQLHRLAGEVMNLAHRECFVKIGNNRPVRTRTVDLEPTFKSAYCRRIMMPLFHKAAFERSPYLHSAAEVDALIATRLPTLAPLQPDPDFTAPAALPIVDAPNDFARAFWANRSPPADPPKPKPKKPRPGRRPLGDLAPRHDRFRVIEGGHRGDKQK